MAWLRNQLPSSLSQAEAAASPGLWLRVRRWLRPATPWVALLGVDGSGKSAVLAGLARTLASTPFTGLHVIHRRPQLVYRTTTQPGPISHYAKPPHNRIVSLIKLGAIALDWLLGYWVHIRWRQAHGILVVADRHALLDLLADPLRYRYAGPVWPIRLLLRLLPEPDTLVLLNASTDVLQARKQELTYQKTDELRLAYLQLAKQQTNHYVIDANQPLPQVLDEVRQVVMLRLGADPSP